MSTFAIDIQDLTGTMESESSELVRNRVSRVALGAAEAVAQAKCVALYARLPIV